jgi:hypothetical protein
VAVALGGGLRPLRPRSLRPLGHLPSAAEGGSRTAPTFRENGETFLEAKLSEFSPQCPDFSRTGLEGTSLREAPGVAP